MCKFIHTSIKLAVLAVFGCSFFTTGQAIAPKEITRILCAPDMHGRGYVSGGDSLAAVFLGNQFAAYGLKPLKSKSYFQPFSFPVNTFPGKMDLQIGDTKLKPGVDFLVDQQSGSYSGELKYKVLDRSVINSAEALAEMLVELRVNNKGTTGVLLITTGMPKDTLKMLRDLAEEMAEFFPVIELFDEKFTWSVSQQAYAYPYIKVRSEKWKPDATISMEIENKFIPKHSTQNVIGYAPAKKRTKKCLFITAHYDHLGRMGKETYFPGANDNASGTSILFGLAKKFIDKPSKYNVVFVAFAGEEAGLIGSKFYTEHPIVPLKKIKFLMNLDIMGSGEDGVTVVNGSVFKPEFDQLVALNDQNKWLPQVKSRGKAANSDHYYFSEKGVPAFFMYTMGPNKNYHDIDDQFDALSFAEFMDIQLMVEAFFRAF